MALCIIRVHEFSFPLPKISWSGNSNSIEYTYGQDKTIDILTDYNSDYTIELQKFNGLDWTAISYNLTIPYNGVGTDRYRIKVSKGGRYKFSNELILVSNKNISIALDEARGYNPVHIKFVEPLDSNVKSFTLVQKCERGITRYDNKLEFVPEPRLNSVYVEILYYDGSKIDTNTVEYNLINEFAISWDNNSKEDKRGYEGSVAVLSEASPVSWQIADDNFRFTQAAFIDGNIALNDGINNIRAYYRSNIYSSNILKYNKLPKGKLFIRWDTGGSLERIILEGTINRIVIDNQYPQEGIASKKINIWTDGVLYTSDFTDDFSYNQPAANIVSFQVVITYHDGLLLESNILTSNTIIIPKITWYDDTREDKRGDDKNAIIKKSGMTDGNTYKLQVKKPSVSEHWITIEGDSIEFADEGEYNIRLIDVDNSILVSNVLKYNKISLTATGTLKWKDTEAQIVDNENTKVVVTVNENANGSYKLVANRVIRNYSDLITPNPTETTYNVGVFSQSLDTSPEVRWDGTGLSQENTTIVLKENVTSGEYDLSDTLRFGLYYIKLQHVDQETSDVGNVLMARIINNLLQIEEKNYYDFWGISKQFPSHDIRYYEVKSNITNVQSGKITYYGLATPDPDGYNRTTTLQKKIGNDGEWSDNIRMEAPYFVSQKSSHLEYFRVKTVLHDGTEIYSNTISTIYVGDMLKLDGDKYVITDTLSNINTSNLYNDTENTHDLTPTLYPEFSYGYEIASNSNTFTSVGNVFQHSSPLSISDVFGSGYIDGINVIRLKVLDKQTNALIGYSNCVWCMFSAIKFKWKEQPTYTLVGTGVYGLGEYKGVVENLKTYHLGSSGKVEIYKSLDENNIATIINSNDKIFNYEGAFNDSLEFGVADTSLQFNAKYVYAVKWTNYLGFSFTHTEKLYSTKVDTTMTMQFGVPVERMYEVKEDNPRAYDIYYQYEVSSFRGNNPADDANRSRFNYVLQKANIGSEDFRDIQYTENTLLATGDYRGKIVVDNIATLYSNTISYYDFSNILKVNGQKSFFGLINNDADRNKLHDPEYIVHLDVANIPEEYKFKVQLCNSSTALLCSDSIRTEGNKKYISTNGLVDVGQEFNKNTISSVNNILSERRKGLTRMRLKVTKDGQVVGYSNTIYIYLDDSTFYFINHTRGNERVSFPVDYFNRTTNQYNKIINSTLFCIQMKQTYSSNIGELYYIAWDGRTTEPNYRNRLATINGDGTYVDRNTNKGIYRYYRKVKIPQFNIWIDLDDHDLEQVIFSVSLSIGHRFIREEHSFEGKRLFIDESSISRLEGGFKNVTINTGANNYDNMLIYILSRRNNSNEEPMRSSFVQLQSEGERNSNNDRTFIYTARKEATGDTKFKAMVLYKGYNIIESAEVIERNFPNLISLVRNLTGNNARVIEQNLIGGYSKVIYANNVPRGFRYQFKSKEISAPRDTYIIDNEGMNNLGSEFTTSDQVTIHYTDSRRSVIGVKLMIYENGTHIGYSNVVVFSRNN